MNFKSKCNKYQGGSSWVFLTNLFKLTSIKLREFMLNFPSPKNPTNIRDYVPYKIKI